MSTFVYAQIIFFKGLALVYGIAFVIAHRQNKALIGDNGITPARRVLDQADLRAQYAKEKRKSRLPKLLGDLCELLFYPIWDRRDTESSKHIIVTILWFAKDRSKLNAWLDGIAMIGIVASLLLLVEHNVWLLWIVVWICQRSLWAVGGIWYAYGWEALLAETGFYAIFLTTIMTNKVIWVGTIRWFLFRIMFGAGITKIKGTNNNNNPWYRHGIFLSNTTHPQSILPILSYIRLSYVGNSIESCSRVGSFVGSASSPATFHSHRGGHSVGHLSDNVDTLRQFELFELVDTFTNLVLLG
mmetsp:Transcript_16372/g.24771  ORF Transcript_16372/g.24771 Transcript_16372/m.24771 type:complete len:299 (+) Transcript_16372:72-968(+)